MGVDPLGPSHTESKSKPPWADNYTIVYSGQVFDEDGKVSFMGDMDDNFWLKINDQVVVQGRGWNNSRSVQLDLGEGDLGWHDFELRVSNGNGGAGRARQQGFGIDKSGEALSKQNVDNTLFEIAKNTDANTMDLFELWVRLSRYDTSKADHTSSLTRQRTPLAKLEQHSGLHHSRGFVQAIDFPKRSLRDDS